MQRKSTHSTARSQGGFLAVGNSFYFGLCSSDCMVSDNPSFLERLGWESVVWAMSALLAALVWYVIAHRKLARQIEKLKDELDQDVEHNLEPVEGGGFQRDKRHGGIVCPRCKADKGAISFLRLEHGEYGDYYHCNGCGNGFNA